VPSRASGNMMWCDVDVGKVGVAIGSHARVKRGKKDIGRILDFGVWLLGGSEMS
jgi:hypothetical protein